MHRLRSEIPDFGIDNPEGNPLRASMRRLVNIAQNVIDFLDGKEKLYVCLARTGNYNDNF